VFGREGVVVEAMWWTPVLGYILSGSSERRRREVFLARSKLLMSSSGTHDHSAAASLSTSNTADYSSRRSKTQIIARVLKAADLELQALKPPYLQILSSPSAHHGRSQDHHSPLLRIASLSLHSRLPFSQVTQVLAIGFLLVILSSALWKNYLPLLVVATYVIAPLPNWLCGRAANHDDFMESGGSGVVDFGRFMTGFLVVMGIGKIQAENKRG
jgi:hypothetical protein